MLYWEQVSPSHVGKGGFAPIMRLSGVLGVGAGFLLFYQRSLRTFILLYIWNYCAEAERRYDFKSEIRKNACVRDLMPETAESRMQTVIAWTRYVVNLNSTMCLKTLELLRWSWKIHFR